MAQKHTHDPRDESRGLQAELRSQLPFEWGVRVHDHGSDKPLTVSFHHTSSAHIGVREVSDGNYAVRVKESGTDIPRRVLHPEDDTDVDLDLARCLDRAVVKAYQFSRTGAFFADE